MWTITEIWLGLCMLSALICRGAELTTASSSSDTPFKLETRGPSLWESGVGEGFRSSAQNVSLAAGAVGGIALLGGVQAHNIALTSLSYGHMLSHTVGEGRFYRGNWELRGELFGGVEFSPSSEWVIGLAPHLRYNFATGTRFVPYFDAGAGVTATSIGPPDLSNIFEFNLQATIGTQVFLRDNLALTLEARYLHMSCAGISDPNRGLNGVVGLIGLTFLF
jgi:lipid A 3-O-deacylase